MNGGALPAALLCAALGLALATAERNAWMIGLAVLTATASAVAFTPVPTRWTNAVFLCCWASVVLSAASVHKPHGLGRIAALALSLNAGFWTGAVTSLSPSKMNLLKALPISLCVFPAMWTIQRGRLIAVKVVSSWLIAVAILAATLQFLPVTPGYLPDHTD
jgi:hypothetical protein